MNPADIRRVALHALGDIAPEVDLEHIDPSTDLRAELDIDSVDFLHFVIAVGKVLRIDVPEVDYPKLTTLDSAVAYLAARAPE